MYVLASYLALVLLATPLHATVPIFLLYAALATAVIGTIGLKAPENEKRQNSPYLLAIPAAIFAGMRLIPFVQWGKSALGADTGAYYQSFNACLASFAACIKEPVAILSYPLYALGIETQTILLILNCVASMALCVGIYRLTKNEWGERAAFWSALTYAISLPQFLFYWSFFLKMEIAAALSLFALHAYAKKQKRAGIYTALTGAIHPIPLVPLVSAIAIAGMTGRSKKYSFSVAMTGVMGIVIAKWNELVGYGGYIISYARGTYAATAEPLLAGHFVGFSFYHDALMLFYIPFALLTIAWHIKKGAVPAIAWYALVSLALISVNAAFHNRFIILFDMASISLAGYALAAFAGRQKNILGKIALIIIFAFLSLYSLRGAMRMEPIANSEEFKELSSLQGKYTGLPIFINNTTYRQFVTGYTKHTVIASSFNNEPWKALKAPSLIYNARRSTPTYYENDPHFSRISTRILRYSP